MHTPKDLTIFAHPNHREFYQNIINLKSSHSLLKIPPNKLLNFIQKTRQHLKTVSGTNPANKYSHSSPQSPLLFSGDTEFEKNKSSTSFIKLRQIELADC